VQEALSGPLLQSIIESVPRRVHLENELQRTEHSLKTAQGRQEQASLAERLTEIHQQIHQMESQFPPYEAEKILTGLGFETSEFGMPVSSLSGGWKMRAALASLLYQDPDLLLFDEPTNHLDIPSVRWLEQFLQGFKGAMILVSHDREFLNRQVNRTISLEPEGMKSYSGNYDFFLKTREEEKQSIEARARNQEQKIKEAQKFIERFRAKATKARQAQSKIKLVKKIELVQAAQRQKEIRFSFPPVTRSGREVVSTKGLCKGFGEKILYRGLDLIVLRGERIAIIGPNGSGKTTLLRMVAGEIEPDEGSIALGHGVSMGYFAQHHSDMLDPQKTVLDEISQVVPDGSISFVRGVCGAFLFSNKDVDKPIRVLSGGEKARVALGKLLVKPGNLMVMDEPTNHLDIVSSERLIDALEEFGGTLLFVSHNQSFINRLATKIWDIRGGRIVEYPGNLHEYYDHLARMEKEEARDSKHEGPGKKNHVHKTSENERPTRKAQKRQRAEKRRVIHETLKPVLAKLTRLEERIAELESRQKEIEKTLADPEVFKNKDKSVPLLNEYHEVRKELDSLLNKWEQGQGELESLKTNLGL
ncbi:MAG: ABC-F family ATP-binding cassette domain-containing protein, partial [Desulfobacteraceae bacterium]|nr:ABC-F family ATP-binding cassette domain-containing protein [Desulfobacteraceae bacterium]